MSHEQECAPHLPSFPPSLTFLVLTLFHVLPSQCCSLIADEQVEYGTFAVETIEAGQAIGEYVGVLSWFSEEEEAGVFFSSQDSQELQVP